MMIRCIGACLLAILVGGCQDADVQTVADRAYEHTQGLVDIGPRSPGSEGIKKARVWIRSVVEDMGYTLHEQDVDAKTPMGPIPMKNLYFDIPGASNKRILLGAHYDSKYMGKMNFVGANDAASSVGLLLSLAQWLQGQDLGMTVRIVFFDGEEAFVSWNRRDSLYGSRAYVQAIEDKQNIEAVLVLDMISDHDLNLIRSSGSDKALMAMLEEVLAEANIESILKKHWSRIEDDHIPFVEKNIPTLHLMDFTFGGPTSPGPLWHTEDDNMENVSRRSLMIMSKIMMEMIPRIMQQNKGQS